MTREERDRGRKDTKEGRKDGRKGMKNCIFRRDVKPVTSFLLRKCVGR
jgi:hypothetical protein